MLKKSSYLFALGFICFNLGNILCYYIDFGFDLILIGGIAAATGLSGIIINRGFKDILGLLIQLTILSFVIYTVLYTQNLPYAREVYITGLFFSVLTQLNIISNEGFSLSINGIIKHPFLNHPTTKVTAALTIVAVLFKIMHWDFREIVLHLISLSLIAWSYLKFLREPRRNTKTLS